MAAIRTHKDKALGPLLVSADNKASLVIVELTTEFLAYRNGPLIADVENLIAMIDAGKIPPGVDENLNKLLNAEKMPPGFVENLIDTLNAGQKPPGVDENLIKILNERKKPPGLDLKLSGSATVGRDMKVAAREIADATEFWTILLVVSLLVIIYRAPLLAFIPLATVYVAVKTSLCVLAILAQSGLVGLFNGIEVYVTVVLYGAGGLLRLFNGPLQRGTG